LYLLLYGVLNKLNLLYFLVNDTGLGSEHFGSSSPNSSSAQVDNVNVVLRHTELPNHTTHHIVTQQGQQNHHHGVTSQSTHIVNGLHHLSGSTCQIVSSVPAVSVVVNDEDGLLPLEPLSNSDYSYALDEQEDLNELFDSFPF
jgi:hypothetical protein